MTTGFGVSGFTSTSDLAGIVTLATGAPASRAAAAISPVGDVAGAGLAGGAGGFGTVGAAAVTVATGAGTVATGLAGPLRPISQASAPIATTTSDQVTTRRAPERLAAAGGRGVTNVAFAAAADGVFLGCDPEETTGGGGDRRALTLGVNGVGMPTTVGSVGLAPVRGDGRNFSGPLWLISGCSFKSAMSSGQLW